jgi:prepilin-type N-terminal cleavage/methylation domain-containing protein
MEQTASPTTRPGFTMLELLVVLSIIAVITSFAMVGFTRIVNQVRMDQAAQTVSYDLQMAFSIVGRNRKPVRIAWDSANVRFLITDRSDTLLFRTRTMGPDSPYKLNNTMFTVSKSMIEIYPPGLAADSLNIRIVNKDLKRTISMQRGGLVRVIKK